MEAYKNTLEDTINSSEYVQGSLRIFPRIILANDWASVKNDLPEEIDIEKACYLLCVDDILEEMLSRREVTHGYF
jgi:hypothetical protein